MKKWIGIIVIMAAVLAAAGCSQSAGRTAQEQLELGQKYLLEYNYEEAVIAFQKALKIEPKQMDAYLGLAKAYRKMDENELELSILEDAREVIAASYDEKDSLFEATAQILERLADLYVRGGETDRAGEVAELADSIHVEIAFESQQSAETRGPQDPSEETSSFSEEDDDSDSHEENDDNGSYEEDAAGGEAENGLRELRGTLEARYGIVTSDEFISCEGGSIKEYPSHVYGILAEQDIDLNRDGGNCLLILRTEGDSQPYILAELYGSADGAPELIASAQIGWIYYSESSFIYLYYDEPAGQLRIVVDFASMGAYTGVNEYGINIFAVHDGTIERLDGWVGGTPLADWNSDINSFLEASGVPYAKYSAETDKRAACSYYRPLCEIEHTMYSTAPDGDMSSYISQGHKLKPIVNLPNGSNESSAGTEAPDNTAVTDAARQGFREAYAQVLREAAAEWADLPNPPYFDIADIDGDSIPELTVAAADVHMCTVDIYQYIDGEAVLIGSTGEFAEFQYLPGENYIYSEFFVNGMGGGLYIQKIENGALVDELFYSPTQSPDQYEKNGEPISTEQFENESAQLRKPGLVTIGYGNGYEITEENIRGRLGLEE